MQRPSSALAPSWGVPGDPGRLPSPRGGRLGPLCAQPPPRVLESAADSTAPAPSPRLHSRLHPDSASFAPPRHHPLLELQQWRVPQYGGHQVAGLQPSQRTPATVVAAQACHCAMPLCHVYASMSPHHAHRRSARYSGRRTTRSSSRRTATRTTSSSCGSTPRWCAWPSSRATRAACCTWRRAPTARPSARRRRTRRCASGRS